MRPLGTPPGPTAATTPRRTSRRVIAGLLSAVSAVLLSTCKLDELVTTPDLGSLVISEAILLDSAAVGSAQLRQVTLEIDNQGPGSISWTASRARGSTWLALSATSGSTPMAVTLTFNPAGLAVADYNDTLIIDVPSSGRDPVRVPVRFHITPCSVSPAVVDGVATDSLGQADCEAPHRPDRFGKLFRLAAVGGDSITVTVRSSDFDPFLTVDSATAAAAPPLAQTDDCLGTTPDACFVYLLLPRSGNYLLEVSSSDARATGTFSLEVTRPRPPADPITPQQLASDSTTVLTVGASILETSAVFRAVVTDPDTTDQIRLEVEVVPIGTPFTNPAAAAEGLQVPPALVRAAGSFVSSGDTAVVRVDGLADDTPFHWRARAIDRTGRASAWIPFGGNSEGVTDFQVAIPEAPLTTASLGQRKSDQVTVIAVGGTTDEATIVLQGTLADPDPGDLLRLEVEIQPIGAPFTQIVSSASQLVPPGVPALATVTGLSDNTNYHWQARTVDETGRSGPWVSFGANPESATDFFVAVPSVPDVPSGLEQFQTDSTSLIALGASTGENAVVVGAMLTDPDPGDRIRLEVEILPLGQAFTRVPTASGTLGPGSTTAFVRVPGLNDDTDYHWQARAVDSLGNASAWAPFGANSESATDLRVAVPASQLVFTTQPNNTPAGAVITPPIVVEAHEPGGGVDTAFAGTITIAIAPGTGVPGATLGGTLAVAGANGVATFVDLTINVAGSGFALRASAAGLPDASSSAFSITAGLATQLAVLTQPSGAAQSGQPFAVQPRVELRDVNGNPVNQPGVTLTAEIATGPLGGVLASTTASTDAAGIATFGALTLSGPVGTYTIRFSVPNLTAVISNAVVLSPGTATHLTITTQPSGTVANGVVFASQPVLQLRDAAENAVGQSGVVVTAALATGAGTLGGTLTVTTDASGVAAFTDLRVTGVTGIRTLQFSAVGVAPDPVSTGIDVVAGAAAQIAMNDGNNQSAIVGTSVATPPSVLITDISGNPVSGVQVTFAAAPGNGAVTPPTPVTSGITGIASATSWTLSAVAGTNTLTATSFGLAGSPVVFTAMATAGSAGGLAIVTQPPSSAQSGVILTTQPAVQIQDAGGNPVSQGGVVVTAVIASGPGGTLGGALTASTDAFGIATFSDLSISGPVGTYTLRFTAPSLTPATSGTTTLSPGAAAQLFLTTQPSSAAQSGVTFPQQPVVQIQDAAGNAVSQSGVLVTAAVETGGGALGGTATATTNAGGTAAFTDLGLSGTIGVRTLRFTAPLLAQATSDPITVGAGPVNQLTITTQPSADAQSGVLFLQQPVIQLRDASGNAVSQAGVQVVATIESGAGTLGGTLSLLTNASGVAAFTDLLITGIAGTRTLGFAATSLTGATSGTITVGAGAATQLTLTTQPSAAGQSGIVLGQQPVVQLRDASANPVSQAGVVVTATIATDPGGTPGLTSATATTNASGVATFAGLTVTGAIGGYTLTFGAPSLTGATSGTITLAAGTAAQLSLTTQPGAAGQSGLALSAQPVVQVRDGTGNAVSALGVVVTATIASDPGGTPTLANATGTTNASGVATFTGLTVTGLTGAYTLSFDAPSVTGVTSNTVTLSAGDAAQLTLTTQPSAGAESGVPLVQQPVVQLRDGAGNAVSQSGVVVTAALATGGGALGGTLMATTSVSGVATFTDLTITGTSGPRTLGFTAPTLTGVTSGTVTLGAGAATAVVITVQPSGSVQNAIVFAQQPSVQLQDASGNAVSQSGVVVTAAIATGGGALGTTLTATTNASGVAAFTDLAITGTIGSRTLSFSAPSLTGATSNAIAVSAGVGAQLSLTAQPSAAAQSGVVFTQQPFVQLQDVSGNPVSQSGVLVTAAIATGGGTLNGNPSTTTDANGTAAFTDLAITGPTGDYTLQFTSAPLTPVTSNTITLGAGAGSQLAITTQPSASAQSGIVFGLQPAIQLQDGSGNAVAQAGVGVITAILTGSGTLGGTLTATTNASGVATFTDLQITGLIGARTVIFAAAGFQSVTSGTVTITPGTAAQLTLTTQPSATAQSGVAFAQQPVVQLRDGAGNAVSQTGTVVTVALALGSGTLDGTLTATTSPSGVATFTDVGVTGTIGPRTLSFTAPTLTGATSNTVNLVAGAAAQLAIITQPSATAQSGIVLGQQPVIQLQDGAGNPVSSAGVVVAAAIATGGGTLGGTLNASTNAAGTATFTNLTLTGTIGSRTLSFSAPTLTGISSAAVSLTAGTPTQLSITAQPSAAVQSAIPFPAQPTIQLRDGSGNPASQAGIIVTAAIATGGGALGGALTATTNASGIATFVDLTITGTIGLRTLTFTAPTLTGATSAAITVSAGTAAALSMTTQPSSTVQSGVAFPQQPVVQLRDGAGNAVSQTGVIVTASIASGVGVLGGTLTATTNASGVASFTNLRITGTVGVRTLSFIAATLSAATSGNVDVTPGVASQLTLTTQPSAAGQSGLPLSEQPVVQLRDASGNAVNQGGVLVAASVATSPGGTPSVTNGTATTSAGGIATFAGLSVDGLIGAYTLDFDALTLVAATSGTVTLSAGVASQISITTQPSPSAQSDAPFTQQPVTQLRDGAGNLVAQAGVTVTASIATGGGALGGTVTAVTTLGGTATFADLSIAGVVGPRTLSFTASSVAAATSSTVVLSAGAATQLTISTQPSASVASGAPFAQQPVLLLRDGAGNAVGQSGVVVTAAIASGGGSLGGTVTATTDASGVATFTSLAISGTIGPRTVTFSASTLTGATSNPVVITAGAATQLSVVTQPSATAQSGVAVIQQPVIQLRDAAGNAVSQSGILVTTTIATSPGGTPTVTNATATTALDGTATFAGLAINGLIGAYALSFNATALTPATSGTVILSAGTASQLSITTQPPSTAQSGIPFPQQPVLQVRDAAGNAVSQTGLVVTAAIATGGGALGGTLTAATNASGTASFTDLSVSGTIGLRTLAFSEPTLAGITSTTVDITAGSASQLSISTPPSAAVQGNVPFPQQPVIQVLDGSGNAVNQAGIVVTATVLTDPGGTPTLTSATATTGLSGTATFSGLSVTGLVGAYTLSFDAPALTGVTSGTITVGAGAATQLTLTTQPSAAGQSGIVLAQQPVVQLRDASSNALSQAGVVVTATIATDPGGTPSLTSATATTNASGVATFAGLTVTGLIGGYTLTFDAPTLTGVTSGTITLAAGTAAQLSLTTQPAAGGQSGIALPTQPVVQVRDGAGNAVSALGVVVTATIATDPGGAPSLTSATAATNASGVATFAGLTVTGLIGAYTLSFDAPSVTGLTSNTVTLSAGDAAALSLTAQPSASAASGVPFAQQPVVQLRDGAGNAVAQSGVVVTAAIATGGGVLGGTLTATTSVSGVATFTSLSITGTGGARTLSLTAPTLTGVTSSSITLGAGAATSVVITIQPSATAQNAIAFGQQPTAQLQDASGNPVSQSGVLVTAAIATGEGVLGTTLTAATNAGGVATFADLSITGTIGPRTLTFSAPSLASATSNTITLTAGVAAQLALTVQPSAAAQSAVAFPQQPVVQLQDVSGNAVSEAGRNVIAALASGTGTLNGTAILVTDAGGSATFTNLAITGATGDYTLQFTSAPLTPVTSNTITLGAGTGSQLAITTAPSASAQSGIAFGQQTVVQLQDGSNNPVAQAGVDVVAAILSGGGTLGGTLTATTNASGVATFTDLQITGLIGDRTLIFAAGGFQSVTSGTVTVTPGTAAQLTLTTQPSATAQSGIAFGQQPVVQVRDGAGNAVSQLGTVVTASIASGGGALGGTTAITTSAAGVATFVNLDISGTVGPRTLSFTATGLATVTSNTITLSAGIASQLSIATPPSTTAQSGIAFPQQPVIQLRDPSGNAVSQASVVVTAAIVTGGGVLGGTLTATTNASGAAGFVDLDISGTVGDRTLNFTSPTLAGVTSGAVTLTAGTASQLSVTTEPSPSAQSGIAFPQQPVIQLRDASGNAVSQASVVVTAAIATGGAALGGTLTATTNASGVAGFVDLAISGTIGPRTVSFTAPSLTVATSGTVTITAGAASQLTLETQPSAAAQSGFSFVQQPVVQLRDASGNAVSQAGVVVTTTIATDPGGTPSLTNATATTSGAGVATFADLTVTGLIGGYTLSFDAASVTGVTSGAVTISAGTAAQLSLTTPPSSSGQSGVALAQQPVVQLRDGAGNTVSQAGVVVTATIATNPGGTPSLVNTTATTDLAGAATFTGLSITGLSGAYTLDFDAPTLTTATSTTITLSVGAATQLSISTQPSSGAQSGVPLVQQPVIQLRDGGGNAVAQSGTVVSAAIASGSGVLGGTLTATTDLAGIATFTNLEITGTAGPQTIGFTATGLAGATSTAIGLTAGAAAQLVLTTQPSSSVQSGIAFAAQPTVQLQDASGNAVSQAAVVVTATIATGGGTIGGTLTASTNASGVATFSNLMITGTIGSRTLSFNGTGLTGATSNSVTVTAGLAAQLALTAQPSANAASGVAFPQQPIVQVQDGASNAVMGTGRAVTATIATGTGTLGGTATVVTDANGTATFANLSITGVTGDYTLQFTTTPLTPVTSNTVTLGAGTGSQLALTTAPSSSVQSGIVFTQQPVIQLQDGGGNDVAQAGVNVVVVILTGGGTLGGTAVATTDVTGAAPFTNLQITGVIGDRTLIFAASGFSSVTSGAVTVTPGTAAQLTLTTQPSATAQSGIAFVQQPAIQVRDGSGNAVSQAGVVVTAALALGSGTLDGTLTAATNVSGVATFTNLGITGTMGPRTLSFTAPALTGATSSTITLEAGTAAQLAIGTQPSATAQSGIALGQQPVIQLQDGAGNSVSQAGVVVTATIATSPGGSPSLTSTTATTNASGVATFSGLAISGTIGSYTLSFDAPTLTGVGSTTITLSAGSAAQLSITTQPSGAPQSGILFAQQPVIQLEDAAGNSVSQASVVVTGAVATGGGTLGGTLTATTNASGVATFTNLTITGTIGARTLMFTAPAVTGVTSSTVTVTAGTAAALSITTQPSATPQSGIAFPQQPVLQLRDGAGNAVSQSGTVVTAAIASGAVALGGTLTATTNASGVASFTNLTITGSVGVRTLSFNATALAGATSSAITLAAGLASQLTISTQPSSAAQSGIAFVQQPALQLRDASSNAVSQSGVVVTATIATGAGGTLTNATATTSASGVATFAGLTLTGAVGPRTLSFDAASLAGATSSTVILSAGTASQLSITTQPSAAAQSGVAFAQQPLIQLRDGAGNAVSQSGVLVTGSIATSPGGTPTVTSATATTDLSGAATFSGLAITGLIGGYTLSFDAATLSAATSGAITLSAGTATQLTITTQPSAAVQSGVVFPQQPVLQLRDAAGNAVSQLGVVVTGAIATGGGTLGGTVTTSTSAGGVATFTDLDISGVIGARTLSFTAPSLAAATSGAVTLSAGPASQLGVTTQPSATVQNTIALAQQPIIQLQDASGNAVSQLGVVVTAAIASGGAALGGTLTASTNAAGVASFVNLAITGTTGARTLSFSAPTLGGATSNTVDVTAGSATQLTITTQPSSTAQSSVAFSQQPVLQLRDVSGNAVSQGGVVVTAAIATGAGVLSGALTASTNASGVAAYADLTITGAIGPRTLGFSAALLTGATSGTITVGAGPATQLTIPTPPSAAAQSGIAILQQPILQLRDGAGNAVSQSGILITATITTSPGGTPSLTNAAATTIANGSATFAGLAITGLIGAYTLDFSAPTLSAATSGTITLSAGAAAQLAITTPPSATGQSGIALTQQPAIQVQDNPGNAVAGAGVVVTATINTNPGGTPSLTNATATTIADGSVTFAGLAVTGLVGGYTLDFDDGSLTTATSGTITLSAGTAAQLGITTQPSAAGQSGIALTQQPVIQVQDGAGNAVGQLGVLVTATIATSPGGSPSLTGATATTNASGVATLAGLTVTGLIGGYTLNFDALTLTGATSNAVTLAAGTAAQLGITTQPSAAAQSGIAMAQQPVIQVQDGAGNAVAGTGVVVTVTIATSPGGTPSLTNATATTIANGSATFAGLTITGLIGGYSLSFNAPTLTGQTSTTTTLSAGAAAALSITTQPSATVQSGVAFPQQPVLQIRDGAGNAVSQSGVVVTAAIATGGVALGGTLTATTNASGSAAFTDLALSGLIGVRTLSFTALSLTGATSSGINVTAGPAAQLSLTTQPSAAAQSGIAFLQQPVLQLRDAAGNAVSQASVLVTATIASDPGGVPSVANATATTLGDGSATFTGLEITGLVGAYTLNFDAPPLTTATSGTITLSAGTAAQIGITTQPSAAGQSGIALTQQPVIQVQDGAGNDVAGAGVAVTATINTNPGGSPSLTSAAATTLADGSATFSGLAVTGLIGGYTLDFDDGSLTTAMSGTITLSAGNAAQLGITTAPPTAGQSGIVLTQQPVIQVQDGAGNAVAQLGTLITATINTNPGGTPSLTSATATTVANGSATFTGLAITGLIGGYTLNFDDGVLTTATSGTITLSAGTAAQLGITTAPSAAAQSGIALTTQPVIQVQDGAGNAVAQLGTLITVTINANPGGSPSLTSATATTIADGSATFAGLAITGLIGGYTLNFAGGGITLATSGTITLSAGTAAQLGITAAPSSTGQSGIALTQQPVVQVQDNAGNAVSQSSLLVTATIASGPGGSSVASGTATTDVNGVATFAGLSITGLIGGYTLDFDGGVLTTATSGTITLSAGTAAQLGITTAPSAAGQSGIALTTQPVIQVQDGAGNAVAQLGTLITVTINANPGGSPSLTSATATTIADGSATFAGLAITGLIGGYTLNFAGGGITLATSGTITLSAGTAAQLGITAAPSSTGQSGIALTQQPVVQVQDNAGNAVSQLGTLITATINTNPGGTPSLASATATTIADGSATFAGLAITGLIGGYTLDFDDGVLTTATSGTITLSAGTAAQLGITTAPSSTSQSGIALTTQPVIQVQDGAGNAVAQLGTLITATINANPGGSPSLTSATATTIADGSATFAGLAITGLIGGYTLDFDDGVLTTATSGTITLSAGTAAQLGITTAPSSTGQSGIALTTQPVIQVQDGAGNAVAQLGTLITATINANPGGSPSLTSATATTIADGSATFAGLAITGLIGGYTLDFDDGVLTTATSGTITLSAGTAAQLGITTAPSAAGQSGIALVQQPVVQVQDGAGNAVSQLGTLITATINTNPGGTPSLASATATTIADGSATFAGLAITGLIGGYTLDFAGGGFTIATSGTITLSAGTAAQLGITTAPSAAGQSGIALTQQPVVQVQDNAGNAVSQLGTLITATINTNPGGTPSLTSASATTLADGSATFAGLAITGLIGGYTLNFAGGGFTLATSGTITLSAGTAAQLGITTAPSAAGQSGIALTQQPVIQVQDGTGNAVSQLGVLVTATILTNPGGTPSLANGTATTLTDGSATFSGFAITGLVGGYTLSFAATGLGTVASGTITLSAGTAASISIDLGDGQAALVDANVATAPSVLVEDGVGNPVSGESVTFAVATGGGGVVDAVQATNASGIATATSWALGDGSTMSGTGTFANSLNATTAGAGAVTFNATSNYSYATHVQPIWDANCTSCHGDVIANGSLDLQGTPTSTRAALVGVTASCDAGEVRVVASSEASSVLIVRMDGGTLGTCSGDMPPAGVLGAGTRDIVRAWVRNGAPNN